MDQRMVKSPAHYTEGRKFEPKDVIRDWGLNFNTGNAVKYLARAGRKDDIVQDLKKAQEYIQFEIDAIEAERKSEENIPKHPNCKCARGSKETIDKIVKDIVSGMDGVELIATAEIRPNEGMIALSCTGNLDPDEVRKQIFTELQYRISMMG